MSKLTKLLEYACAGNSKRRSLMDNDSFINSFNKTERQLMLSETGETDLIVREILNAVVVGAEERRSARNLLPIVKATTNKVRIPYAVSPSGQYSGYVAEGATIPIDVIRYSATNIDIKKAAIRVPITKELIEDEQFNVIELELKKAGAKLENQLNREAINTMLNLGNAAPDVDPTPALVDIGLAKKHVDNRGWTADSVFLESHTYAYMLDEINFGDITLGDNKVIGLNVDILDATTGGLSGSSDNYAFWDDTDTGYHYGGIVFDSQNFAVIAMREDINTSRIEDPIHDLTNLVVKMRFGVGVLNSGAACRILTK